MSEIIHTIGSLTEGRRKDRDKKHLDPTERANLINTFILHSLGLNHPEDLARNPLFWDLTCYSTEMLNAFALQSGEDDMLALAKAWSNTIFSRHYSFPDGMNALGPSRDRHEQIWLERIDGVRPSALTIEHPNVDPGEEDGA